MKCYFSEKKDLANIEILPWSDQFGFTFHGKFEINKYDLPAELRSICEILPNLRSCRLVEYNHKYYVQVIRLYNEHLPEVSWNGSFIQMCRDAESIEQHLRESEDTKEDFLVIVEEGNTNEDHSLSILVPWYAAEEFVDSVYSGLSTFGKVA